MLKYFFIISALAAFAFASDCDSDDGTCKAIDAGCICGMVRNAENGVKYISFRGIPYATQPVGELRFKELQPVVPWDDKMQTIEEGPICPQYDELYGRLANPQQGMSEACIYANVHVPIVNSTDPLPILVHVHGGNFQAGSGNADLHGPEFLVSNDVIVITFNYRINVFGFFTMNNEQFPGNNGLRDIYTLLKWVQTNACAFGGNPENVTLMGQGSGATAAHLMSLSNATEGLFQRAILMSGTGFEAIYSTSTIYSDAVAKALLISLNINSTDADFIHDQLTKIPLEDIMTANRVVETMSGPMSFVPTVEAEYEGITRIIDDNPVMMVEGGRNNNIPLLIGFSTKESEFFKRRLRHMDYLNQVIDNPTLLLRAGLAVTINDTLGRELGGLIMKRYFSKKPTLDEYLKVNTDVFYIYPAFKLAYRRSKQPEGAPVYLYQFSYDSAYNVVKDALKLNYVGGGASNEDLTNVFRTNSILPENEKTFPPINRDHAMKYAMTQIVVNFMNCDQPNCDNPEAWPALNADKLNYQLLNDPIFNFNQNATKKEFDMITFFDDIGAKAGFVTN